MKLIFNNVRGAAASAQYLRGEWDGFNSVLFNNSIDLAAVRIAIASVEQEIGEKVEYCRVGEFCSLFTETTLGSIPILGYSNIEQLRLVYGSEEVRAIISNCSTKVVFNPQEVASVEEMVNRLCENS
jgi:Type IV secretion-system coupling protein DNA-binding domain